MSLNSTSCLRAQVKIRKRDDFFNLFNTVRIHILDILKEILRRRGTEAVLFSVIFYLKSGKNLIKSSACLNCP